MSDRLIDLARDIKVAVKFIEAVNPDNIEVYPPDLIYEFLEEYKEQLEASGLLVKPTRVALKLLSKYGIPIAISPYVDLEDQREALDLLAARDEAEFKEALKQYRDALKSWANLEMEHVSKEELAEVYGKIGKLVKSGTAWEFWDHVWWGERYEGTASISLDYEIYDVRAEGIPRFGVFVKISIYHPPPDYVSDVVTVDYALCDTFEEAQENLKNMLADWKERLRERIRSAKDILSYYEELKGF